jgi:ring-1,2-phenylacetyl-CoA epoxidase subunit PaaD
VVIGTTPVQPNERDVRAALARIPDPELPVLSIVDLGIVHRVDVGADGIDVAILPTFVGCPALDVIRSTIVERIGEEFDRPVRVRATFEEPWTSDRISPEGIESLRRAGIAPPADPADVRCPHCASANVVMDSAFGPTQCRSLFYCRGCRQPFEAMKSV